MIYLYTGDMKHRNPLLFVISKIYNILYLWA
jgi:hypothetical protein